MQLNNLIATEESSGSEQGEAVARDEDDNGKCNFNMTESKSFHSR